MYEIQFSTAAICNSCGLLPFPENSWVIFNKILIGPNDPRSLKYIINFSFLNLL